MAGRHFNSRHDDETWIGFFMRWHAGEDRRALMAEAGVSHDTWTANAKRLGMRRCDLPDDHPGRRPFLPLALRPDDFKHPRSLLSEGQWRELFARRAAGVSWATLRREYGVSRTAIACQARERGLRLCDLKPPPEGPATYDPQAVAGPVWADDPARTLAENLARFGRAHAEGRVEDAVAIERLDRAAKAMLGRRGAGAEGLPHPGACGACPPHEGEGDGGWADHGVTLHEHQRAPEGDWSTWLMLGGRGAGKTFAGAWWLAEEALRLGAGGRLALVGATLHDVREVMVEGGSGLIGLPRWRRADGTWDGPVYEAGRRRVRFPGGAYAYAFSAEDADSLRGPQFHAAWADEFCAWAGDPGRTLALLRMGLRLTRPVSLPLVGRDGADGARVGPCEAGADLPLPDREAILPPHEGEGDLSGPRLVVTTTPRPSRALRELRLEPGFVESRAGTAANAGHLAPGFVEGLRRLYGGTRLEAQELEGRVVELDGALFTAGMMAAARGEAASDAGGYRASRCLSPQAPSDLERIVVAVDPSAVTGGGSACGIVAAGLAGEVAWVLADRSCAGLSPGQWAERTAATVEAFGAQCVVVEVNQGGEMVEQVLRASGVAAPVRQVRASRGKRARAEPVAALYEQGRVRHAGALPELEEELMALGTEGEAASSLDRADALVWAVTDLLIDRPAERAVPRVRSL